MKNFIMFCKYILFTKIFNVNFWNNLVKKASIINWSRNFIIEHDANRLHENLLLCEASQTLVKINTTCNGKFKILLSEYTIADHVERKLTNLGSIIHCNFRIQNESRTYFQALMSKQFVHREKRI